MLKSKSVRKVLTSFLTPSNDFLNYLKMDIPLKEIRIFPKGRPLIFVVNKSQIGYSYWA